MGPDPTIRSACAAALEILAGVADQQRTLELAEHITVAKVLLQRVVSGELVLVAPKAAPAASTAAAAKVQTHEPAAGAMAMLND